jgi:hypothetical protein
MEDMKWSAPGVTTHTLAKLSIPILAGVVAASVASRTQPGADPCHWLTPGTLLSTIGHHFDTAVGSPAVAAYPGDPTGMDCVFGSESAFSVHLIGYVHPAAAQASESFEKIAGLLAQANAIRPQRHMYTKVPGVGNDAYLDQDTGLHVLTGRVRFMVDVHGIPNKQGSERALASHVMQVAPQ